MNIFFNERNEYVQNRERFAESKLSLRKRYFYCILELKICVFWEVYILSLALVKGVNNYSRILK